MDIPDLVYWAPLGNLQQLGRAIAANPDVNVADEDGYTALHGAAENNRLEVVRLLLVRGANPNPRDRLGNSPIDYAAREGFEAIMALLREHGAEPARDLSES